MRVIKIHSFFISFLLNVYTCNQDVAAESSIAMIACSLGSSPLPGSGRCRFCRFPESHPARLELVNGADNPHPSFGEARLAFGWLEDRAHRTAYVALDCLRELHRRW